MKKLLKPADEELMKRWMDQEPIAQVLKELKHFNDISIGEVLVKRDMTNGQVVLVSGTCPVPKKYRVVAIDELGVPWIKQISMRGGLGTKIYPLTHFTPTRFKFEIDPERLDAELLGIKYDCRIEYKRMRDANPKYGKE